MRPDKGGAFTDQRRQVETGRLGYLAGTKRASRRGGGGEASAGSRAKGFPTGSSLDEVDTSRTGAPVPAHARTHTVASQPPVRVLRVSRAGCDALLAPPRLFVVKGCKARAVEAPARVVFPRQVKDTPATQQPLALWPAARQQTCRTHQAPHWNFALRCSALLSSGVLIVESSHW